MPPSNSQVPKIELNHDGTITLYVDVYNFEAGTPIEVSGQATQMNGAVAAFYDVKEMPDTSGGGAVIEVTSKPAAGQFVAGFPVTVVARATEAWITTLDTDSGEYQGSEAGSVKAAWKSNSYDWAVSPTGQASPLPPDQASQASAPQPPGATSKLWHGTWWGRALEQPVATVMAGRFTRLFPNLPAARFDPDELKQLAEAMTAPPEPPVPENKADPEENRDIPAAYTYLGQFVDHDLTFDPTSQLRESLTARQLERLADFRTPRFDLDNLYGRGPGDQPYMYKRDGVRMLLGQPMSGNPFDPGAVQLPRGPSGRALIGDPRNDENRIVAQLHAVFLRFHNRVARHLGKDTTFQAVRQQVRWHYQWMLVTDFLRKILDARTYQEVFPDPYTLEPRIPGLQNGIRKMPVEFSVAAYRFGHSMIRSDYRLNTTVERRPIFSADTGQAADLGGLRPIPDDWAIDWQFFIDIEHAIGAVPQDPPPGVIVRKPQLSYKIDTSLVHPLGHLPPRVASDPSSLARRNLERGVTFRLPSGQEVARALGMEPIPDQELVIGMATADAEQKPITKVAPGFAGNAPLWAYILSEAQVTSWKNADRRLAKDKIPIKLGPLGGRIVADVFASLLLGDPTSYLHADGWFAPDAAFTRNGMFGLAELINVALGRAGA
jgi:Animal haem peroxidase